MPQSSTNPLLNLPDDEIIRKLREMNLEEICKELVESIEIKGDFMPVSIGSDIAVSIKIGSKSIQLTYYRERNMYWGWGAYGRKSKLTEPQSVLVEVTNFKDHSEDTTFELGRRDFTMKGWLEQLQDIFSYPKIDCIWFFHSSFEFDIDDIKEVFENTAEMKIGDTGCHVFNQMILRKFLPCEKLSIKASNFPNSTIPEGILVQHFDKLQVGHFCDESSRHHHTSFYLFQF
ncbi:hypothetical protein CAEBREN_10219 [Caenorhabditis brenneri]|uniref:Uncharacterized protein n=1 Tax=Caenorhabditis brenneri TaxID=135651 RepID=G0N0G9_CAEBE|nr:hypothetical protein CAEBREN_10219 [Caenorhabditis brenneri]